MTLQKKGSAKFFFVFAFTSTNPLLFVLITMAFVEITIDLWFIFLLTLLQITDKDIVYSYRKTIQNENFNNCCNI